MSNVSNASNGQNGLVNIFSTYEADPVVTTSDKEPPLPYSTKLYLAARICKSVEREAGPATDDTVRKTAALSDDLLIKLAVNNGVQFILNHDGTVHRRPDPWGIVRKDAYGKYDPPEWEGRG